MRTLMLLARHSTLSTKREKPTCPPHQPRGLEYQRYGNLVQHLLVTRYQGVIIGPEAGDILNTASSSHDDQCSRSKTLVPSWKPLSYRPRARRKDNRIRPPDSRLPLRPSAARSGSPRQPLHQWPPGNSLEAPALSCRAANIWSQLHPHKVCSPAKLPTKEIDVPPYYTTSASPRISAGQGPGLPGAPCTSRLWSSANILCRKGRAIPATRRVGRPTPGAYALEEVYLFRGVGPSLAWSRHGLMKLVRRVEVGWRYK